MFLDTTVEWPQYNLDALVSVVTYNTSRMTVAGKITFIRIILILYTSKVLQELTYLLNFKAIAIRRSNLFTNNKFEMDFRSFI